MTSSRGENTHGRGSGKKHPYHDLIELFAPLKSDRFSLTRLATWGEESDVDASFNLMKTNFVDKGIPVLLGEYGAYRRDNTAHVPLDLPTHEDAVDYWNFYVTKQAKTRGMLPFYWDTGGALDRRNYTVKDQRTITAIKQGAN